jgi:hypothetical protein
VKGKSATRKALVPKAGPKKKAAKSEAELIRDAVAEHGKRGVRALRKSGKVTSYNYKEAEAAKRKRVEQYITEQDRLFSLRQPHGPTPFDDFKEGLADDARVFAKLYWTMRCEHRHETPVTIDPSIVHGTTVAHMSCPECGLIRSWCGTRAATKRREWESYCPEGFDMFDWCDLYVPDRSLWQYIHDEALADMLTEAMKEDQ